MAVERFDPISEQNKMVLDHYARYLFAAPIVSGKRVLDIACGFGYGSYLLADHQADSVVGIDVSDVAIVYAQTHYAHENILYIVQDILSLSKDALGLFDVIVCFETIEHIADPKGAIHVLSSLLTPDGLLIISVPNEGEQPSSNPFHLTTFTQKSFSDLLNESFVSVEFYCQSYVLGSGITRYIDDIGLIGTLQHVSAKVYEKNNAGKESCDCFIGVCKKSEVQDIEPIVVLSAQIWREIDTYIIQNEKGRQWLEEQRQNWHAEANKLSMIMEQQQQWVNTLEQARAWSDEQQKNWQSEAEHITRLFTEQQQQNANLEQSKAWLEQQFTNWKSEATKLSLVIDEQRIWIEDLEKAKAWYNQQSEHWQQQSEHWQQQYENIPEIFRRLNALRNS